MSVIHALRCRVSRSALESNARASVRPGDVADLRRDACGHGAPTVAAVLAASGIRRARVDDGTRDAALGAGLEPTDEAPTLDLRTLYGLPGGHGTPAMTATGSVFSSKRLLRGEGVSYNYTHVAPRDTHVALVSGGFGQGVARALGNVASVEIAGALYPVIGRVAMDVCMVDIDETPVAPGDEVVYFGGDGPARDALAVWERATGMTAAELVCAIGVRVREEETA